MSGHNCPNCTFKAKYDKNPGSFLGRIWRWHIKWCPGWKKYMGSLSEGEKEKLVEKYGLK